jgi:rubrerythrin
MASKILTNLFRKKKTNQSRQTLTKFGRDKPTTLSREYPCGVCGEPAMTKEGDRLRCPSCWLREQGQQIKPIDRGGYYP